MEKMHAIKSFRQQKTGCKNFITAQMSSWLAHSKQVTQSKM